MNTYAYTREPEFLDILREVETSGDFIIVTDAPNEKTIGKRIYRNALKLRVTYDKNINAHYVYKSKPPEERLGNGMPNWRRVNADERRKIAKMTCNEIQLMYLVTADTSRNWSKRARQE